MVISVIRVNTKLTVPGDGNVSLQTVSSQPNVLLLPALQPQNT